MTLYGWDLSHYQGRITKTTMAKAKSEGVTFLTHKIGEGTGGADAEAAANLAAARAVGIEFLGGYHVVRSGSVTPQVDALLRLADAAAPWWKSFPGWFWQVDLERWPYDDVPAATGVAFARELRQRTGRWVVLYASHGEYGDGLTGWDGPLWNANYGSNPAGAFKSLYPGDGGPGWGKYSGKTPVFWQYGSRTTIAGVTTCDANAYRGSLEELRALIGGAMTDVWSEDVIPRFDYDGNVLPPTDPNPTMGAGYALGYAAMRARDAVRGTDALATQVAALDAKLDQVLAALAAGGSATAAQIAGQLEIVAKPQQ